MTPLLRNATNAAGLVALALLGGAVLIASPQRPAPVGDGAPEVTAWMYDVQAEPLAAGTRQQVFGEAGYGWAFDAKVNADTKVITVTALSLDGEWTVSFGGPERTLPTPGTYDATGGSNAYRPSVSVTGPLTYCGSGSVGRFTVHQLEMASASQVTRFAASFEVNCTDWVPGRVGEVRFHSTGVDLAAVTADAEQISFAPGQTTTITLVNRGNIDQTLSAQLAGPFPEAFTILSNTCGLLTPGASCTVDVAYSSAGPKERIAWLEVSDQTIRGGRYVRLIGSAAP